MTDGFIVEHAPGGVVICLPAHADRSDWIQITEINSRFAKFLTPLGNVIDCERYWRAMIGQQERDRQAAP
ncbi:MAG: hypothetical protein IPN21_18195 [Burkholderiales bacterium]|nr:hypothetical protein [Burkholderiales bacterium]